MSEMGYVNGVQERRREPRLERIFRIFFNSPDELKEKYTKDISKGGFFVVSDFQPPIDTFVEVQMFLPEREQPIQVTGRVAHVVDAYRSVETNLPEGFGVEFVRFFDNDEVTLKDYVDNLHKSS